MQNGGRSAPTCFFRSSSRTPQEKIQVSFLLEHKGQQDAGLLQQLLQYQTSIYAHKKMPIIPVLVYHGREKNWNRPLNFQDSLTGMTPRLRQYFGKNILDFNCRLLNMHKLDLAKKRLDNCSHFIYNVSKFGGRMTKPSRNCLNFRPVKTRQNIKNY